MAFFLKGHPGLDHTDLLPGLDAKIRHTVDTLPMPLEGQHISYEVATDLDLLHRGLGRDLHFHRHTARTTDEYLESCHH